MLGGLAPPFGVLPSTFVAVGPTTLGLLLSGFARVFLAVGAGHLLPEAQHQRPGQAPALVFLAAIGAGMVLAIRVVIG